MHDTGESSGHFGEWGEIEHGIILEGDGAIGYVLIGKMPECFGVDVMSSVGYFEDASSEGTVHLIVVDLIFNVCPVVFFAGG